VHSTCLFCHASLGRNEVIEQFPVGRRLAFDTTKGRLWAVCRKCGGEPYPFLYPFLPAKSDIMRFKSGADARFP
jgi:hypothetical protein